MIEILQAPETMSETDATLLRICAQLERITDILERLTVAWTNAAVSAPQQSQALSDRTGPCTTPQRNAIYALAQKNHTSAVRLADMLRERYPASGGRVEALTKQQASDTIDRLRAKPLGPIHPPFVPLT